MDKKTYIKLSPNEVKADIMGPGEPYYVDPHVTPNCVKDPPTKLRQSWPTIFEIAHKTYMVNELGITSFYVLVGNERGLVIDSGSGSLNTKEYVEHLCTLPYDVALSHAHGDHCGGINLFDRVWLHPAEMPFITNFERVNQQLWADGKIWRGSRPYKYPDGTVIDYPGYEKGAIDLYDFSNLTFMGVDSSNLPEILPLEDGQVFDLGGRKVTVLNIPGHTVGSCVFIDDYSRIAFLGDAMTDEFNLPGASVTSAVRSLEKFAAHRDKFDGMYPNDCAHAACTMNFSQTADKLDDAIKAYRGILDGTATIEKVTEATGGRGQAKTRMGSICYSVYGKARCAFKPDRLIDEGEEPV